MSIVNAVKKSAVGKKLLPLAKKIRDRANSFFRKREADRILRGILQNKPHLFNCGVCETSNMGDIAQNYCFLLWAKQNYPRYQIISLTTTLIMDEKCRFLERLGGFVNEKDMFFFQSGYNTNDFGSPQDAMRQKIAKMFPHVPMIVMPQTVLFKTAAAKQRCQEVYNAHGKMLFLARDPVSYEYAKEMFPKLCVMPYPDIVTTLIGKKTFVGARQGICLCRRKDKHEQFYTEEQYQAFRAGLSTLDTVEVMNTVVDESNRKIRRDIEGAVWRMIHRFASYRLVVTDKFHGTIFSLIAGTPVIVLKTKDHKVTTGYELFQKHFPDRVFHAQTVEEAVTLGEKILDAPAYSKLDDCFDREYYQKLGGIIQAWMENI